MTRQKWSRNAAAAALALGMGKGQAWAVDYANIDVVDGAVAHVDPPTVLIPAGQSTVAGTGTEGFFIDPGTVVGEIPIRIGASAANDADQGILIVSAREILRTLGGATQSISGTTSTVRDDDPTSENTRNLSGGLAIVTDRAGNDGIGSSWPTGGPMNLNVGATYFPFSQGWKGGTVYASVNNGPLDTFIGSPGFTFDPTVGPTNTAHVRPNHLFDAPYDVGDPTKNGNHVVSIPGVTDSRQQGILLAMSAKNEDNYATVSALADGEGWHVNTRGNSQGSPNDGESKPFSFVFVPVGTPNVTMGAIWGAQGPNNEPTPVLKSGSNFNIVKTDMNGTYRLTIDGETPSSGVLHVQSGNNLTGNGSLPGDNIVPYMPDGDGWIITSDDMENVNQTGANQNGESGQRIPYFQFVFTSFNAAPGAPTIQAPAWTRSDVFGFDVQVTEIRGYSGVPEGDPNYSNDQNDANGPDMYTAATGGTQGLDFVASRMNKGDNAVHVNGALPTPTDGVMLATISEGLRNNTATGGYHEYGVVGVSAPGGQWEVHTAGADASTGEFNINYSVAFFGKDSGFQMGVRSADDVENGFGEVTLSGVNSLTDGVLMAVNGANEDNFVVVNPKNDGSGWDVQNWDNGLFVQDHGFNYVYLPYETENLVAGRVNPDGSLINSTDTGAFTLVKEATGTYLLTVNGRTSEDGMLLLVSGNGDAASSDNNLVYEAAGNSFRILGVDLVSNIEKEAGAFTTLEDTSFQFAFIDYITPPVGPGTGGDFLAADFNQDGSVNGADLAAWKGGFGTGTTKAAGDADLDGDVDGSDFLTWQRQLGTLPPATAAAAAVPEPHAAVLMACGVAVAALCRGRRS